METIKANQIIIGVLIIFIYFIIRSRIKKSREGKKFRSTRSLKRLLTEGTCPNFQDYSLDILKSVEKKIDTFLIETFKEEIWEVTSLVNSVNNVKDKATQDYLKTLMTTVINNTEIGIIANLIFANLSGYLHCLRGDYLSNYEIENLHIKYFKFNSLILFCLNKSRYSSLIKIITELIERDKVPKSLINKEVEKWYREEKPILLRAELSKIKMQIRD